MKDVDIDLKRVGWALLLSVEMQFGVKFVAVKLAVPQYTKPSSALGAVCRYKQQR